MAKSPFRDREVAAKHRAEREANDERVRAEEAAEAARRKKLMRNTAPVVGFGAVVWGIVRVIGALGSVDERQAEEARRRELAAVVAATKPVLVAVDQGGVRPATDSTVTSEWVRTVVDRHADELGGCFSDGLGTGALALGAGPSHAFAFSWVIDANGSVSSATAVRSAEPTDVERCMIDRIRTWTFGDMKGRADVIGWMFERCPTTREECVHPK